jgi:hypothetical protein
VLSLRAPAKALATQASLPPPTNPHSSRSTHAIPLRSLSYTSQTQDYESGGVKVQVEVESDAAIRPDEKYSHEMEVA